MSEPRTRLTLVGTVHRDSRGGERLLPLLRELRPDLLTLEMSEAALAYRQHRGLRLLQRLERILDRLAAELGRPRQDLAAHGAVADIRTLLALPYEYQASLRYAAEAAVPLHLIDRSDISSIKLQRVEAELITYPNLRILVDLPARGGQPTSEGYETARAMMSDAVGSAVRSAFLERRRGEEGVGSRDRWMAQEIRRFLAGRPCQHLVHVGGWVHLVEDTRGETLYALLTDLQPRRLLLA